MNSFKRWIWSIVGILLIATACSTNTTGIKHTKKQSEATAEDSMKQKENSHTDKKKTTASLPLTNTYTTQFAKVNAITYPAFQFAYPNNWKLTTQETNQQGERVVLSNKRGATITFSHISGVGEGELGGGSTTDMERVEFTRVVDSAFVPGSVQATDDSQLGKFVVAKGKVTGHIDMTKDKEFTDVDGAVTYAVLPQARLGTREDVRHPMESECAFWYSGYLSMTAQAPKGSFTAEEEQEVIAILASFQTA